MIKTPVTPFPFQGIKAIFEESFSFPNKFKKKQVLPSIIKSLFVSIQVAANSLPKEITITETIGKGLVELIENGKINSLEMKKLLSLYIAPMMKQQIDCLVLGCTHYPYLIPQIRAIVGNKIKIIDSGQAVAIQTKAILEKHQLLNIDSNNGRHQFYINKNKKILETLISNTTGLIEINKKDF